MNEQDFFEALERQMGTRMASSQRTRVLATYKPRRVITAVLLLVAGIFALVTAVAINNVLVGIAGFGVMFAGGMVATSAVELSRRN